MRLLFLITLIPWSALAQEFDRSGVRPEVLSLPDGPGSIEGLGDTFEPNPATGTASYSVAFQVPPGVGGFVPSLALSYSSGAGNGPYGLGWQLSLPMVMRSTERGMPRYDGADAFTLSGLGGDELVPLANGDWRCKVEGAFIRARQTGDGWSVWTPDGVRYDFGTGNARIADGPRVMKWLLSRMTHPVGHTIDYVYAPGPDGQVYLQTVVYNDFSPAVRNEVRFAYEGRPDVFTSHRAGFPVTTAQRLSRVEVRHGARVIRTYAVSYTEGLSRISRVQLTGEDGMTSLPALSMDYARFSATARVVTVEGAPAVALGATAEIDDVDGDALPDVLVLDPDAGHAWYPNLDGQRFGARTPMDRAPVSLNNPGVQLADMDGDGAADLVARVSDQADGFRFYRGGDAAGFGEAQRIQPNPPQGFSDPDVRLVDLDLDRLTDWIRTDAATGEVVVAYNQGGGAFSAPERLPPVDPVEIIRFATGARLADVNGDGLSDVVAVRSGSVRYWPGTGFGRFDAEIVLEGAPILDDGELSRLQVRDLDGDGLADLAAVGVRTLRVWLNHSGVALGEELRIDDTPVVGVDTVIRTADMNGNGSTDILWIEPGGGWQYVDLLDEGSPGLLTRIDNGLGKITRLTYTHIGEMRALAREEGIAWDLRSPIGQHLLGSIEEDDGIDAPMVRRFVYADGYYDGESREFRGFRRSRVIEEGDDEQPTLVTDRLFDVGREVEALEGKVLREQRATRDRQIFDVVEHTYEARTLGQSMDGREVVFAPKVTERRDVYEGAAEPITLLSEWAHDEHGNVIVEARYGRVVDGDVRGGDDEVIIEREFAKNPERWIIQAPSREVTQNIDRERLAERRTYYDGEAFEGLAMGRIDVGLASRVESWIEADVFADERRARFDAFGNEVEFFTKTGVQTQVTYDDESHTFAIEEALVNPNGPTLRWQTAIDRAHGGVTAFTNANGHTTGLDYDPLHRLSKVVKPGDSREVPTTEYRYALGAPYSFVETRTLQVTGGPTQSVKRAVIDGAGRDRCVFHQDSPDRWATEACSSYGPRGFARKTSYPRFVGSPDMPAMDAMDGTTVRFDATGRALEEVEVDGATRRMRYDPLAVTKWDENDTDPDSPHANTPTIQRFDGLERVREVVELEGMNEEAVTDYTYDALGNLVELVDAEGSALRWTFDGRSRRRSFDDPNGGTWRFEYNPGDQLVERAGPTGRRVRVAYDGLSRLIEEWHQMPDAEELLFSRLHYDTPHGDHPDMANTLGLLTWAEDPAGMKFFGYDDRSRVRQQVRRWDDGTEDAERTLLDNEDRVLRREFPDGTRLDYSYDARGNPLTAGRFLAGVEWTAWNTLSSVTFDNGLTRSNRFDARNRVREVQAQSGPETIHHTTLMRDASSRVVEVADMRPGMAVAPESHSKVLRYDARYRLRESMAALGPTRWDYDRVGNIRGSTSDRVEREAEYAYDDPAHPDRVTAVAGKAIGYDPAGRIVDDGDCQLEYDAAGRLVGVTSEAGTEAYVYDYEGKRVIRRTNQGSEAELRILAEDAERVDGEWRFYAFVGGDRAVRFGPDGLARRDLGVVDWSLAALLGILLAGLFELRRRPEWLLVASMAAGLSCDDGGGTMDAGPTGGADGGDADGGGGAGEAANRQTIYYVRDYANSVVAATGSNGAIVAQATYDAYGTPTSGEAAVDGWAFSGNRYDPGSGLIDFGRRQFSAKLGRFYDVDPILKTDRAVHPSKYLAYAYAASDPVNLTDRDGEETLIISAWTNDVLPQSLGGANAIGIDYDVMEDGSVRFNAIGLIDEDVHFATTDDWQNLRDVVGETTVYIGQGSLSDAMGRGSLRGSSSGSGRLAFEARDTCAFFFGCGGRYFGRGNGDGQVLGDISRRPISQRGALAPELQSQQASDLLAAGRTLIEARIRQEGDAFLGNPTRYARALEALNLAPVGPNRQPAGQSQP